MRARRQVLTGRSSYIAKHSGQCLDVPNSSTADGAQVIQWPCTGSANQRFATAPKP